jgi:hypothetical protein
MVVISVLAGFGAAPAAAVPLTDTACERYAGERRTLARLGVRDHYLKGATWAQANLTQPQLDLIERYIRLDEALKFRCPEQFAALSVERSDTPRRLDVTPPVPGQKPARPKTETGVTRNEIPPLPARDPENRG